VSLTFFIVNQKIKMPFTSQFMARSGPIIPRPWQTIPDALNAIVRGTISGFHAPNRFGKKMPIMVITHKTEIAMIGQGAMSTEAYAGLAVNFGFPFLLLLMA
jgi:carbon starvation protein CstA